MKTAIRILSACAAALCLLVLGAALDGIQHLDDQPTPTAAAASPGRTLHASATEPARRPHPSALAATSMESRR